MEKSLVSKIVERIPRALEVDRGRAWQLIQSHPELIGLRPPIPPKVAYAIRRHIKELHALDSLRGSPIREERPRNFSDRPYVSQSRRKLCKICKVVHTGKLPREHYQRLVKYQKGKARWYGTTSEQRSAHMHMMCNHRRRQQYSRAIDRRVAMLHPGFVAHIGRDAAFQFCENGVRRHGWDFLITTPISLIKSHAVHWHDTAQIAPFRQKLFPDATYDDLKLMLQQAMREKVCH